MYPGGYGSREFPYVLPIVSFKIYSPPYCEEIKYNLLHLEK